MNKVDYKQDLKQFYASKVGQPVVVDIPEMNFIMIDGKGDPNNNQEYMDAIQTLYPVAYTIKFTSKLKNGNDFTVMPLESLWWTEDMSKFSAANKDDWQWTAMIMQPEVVTEDLFDEAMRRVAETKSPPALSKVRFEAYDEGRAAQVMYIGPYSEEGPTILKLHEFIFAQGGTLDAHNKHHHEIYLGDPRRTAPERLKTLIRQPF